MQTTTEVHSPAFLEKNKTSFVFFLFFLSGLAGLVYEVLWFRAAGVLFGNTAYAAATVLASFFAGLLLGNVYWGRLAGTFKKPLFAYAGLEIAIGISAALYFLLKPVYFKIYLSFFPALSVHETLLTVLQFILSSGFILLPSFFMGGTLPVLLEWSVREGLRPERAGTLFYAVNTVGAAFGALIAGFYLPLIFGFQTSYLLTLGLTFFVALAAIILSRSLSLRGGEADRVISEIASLPSVARNDSWIWIVAFVSGFLTLGLEVLWTQMFAQVLHNSVYTFSAVLVTFLLALGAGSIFSHVLLRLKFDSHLMLFTLSLISGVLAGVTPFLFYFLTGGLRDLWAAGSWDFYLSAVFSLTMLTIGFPVILIGAIFPYLLKWSRQNAGYFSGRILAWNALGSVAGSIAAGFFLLKWFGLWQSICLIAIFYFALSLFLARKISKPILTFIPVVGIVIFFTILNPSHLPLVYLEAKDDEKLLQVWEGRYGPVSVIKSGSDLKLRANNYFGLGGTGSRHARMAMADLPILLHSQANSIFFLGMGTGITAGRSLDHPSVKRVVVSELVPEVVEAARAYFSNEHNLFNDPRVDIHLADGRNYLLAHPESFNLVIGDLFFPWESGTGSLYTREHFEVVLGRLKPGGLFAQWLPLYQMTDREFSLIAKTMLEVFPLVTLWRGDFLVDRPIMVLIGHREDKPLEPDAFVNRFLNLNQGANLPRSVRTLIPLAHYAGNLNQVRDLFKDVPINTDDHPFVEYLAPKSFVAVRSGKHFFLTSVKLAQFVEEISRQAPFETDPFLQKLSPDQLDAIHSGLELYVYEVARENDYPYIAEVYQRRLCDRLGSAECKDFRALLEHRKKSQ